MAELREEVISISAFVLAAGPSLTVRKRGWGGGRREEKGGWVLKMRFSMK